MKTNFIKVYFIFLVAAEFLFSTNSNATHLTGADLTYSCVGGNDYEFVLSFYYDCSSPSGHPAAVLISFGSASCSTSFIDTLMLEAGSGQQVYFTCQPLPTACDDSTSAYSGIRKFRYSGITTLPMQCSDWVISWHYCCRSCNISNIIQPQPCTPGSAPQIYIASGLDNLNFNCNSSPQFSAADVIFLCVGQPLIHNPGATDSDGDSLAFSFVDPMADSVNLVPFLPGYWANIPITSSPTLFLNPASGEITIYPVVQEIDALAVRVDEFRNGMQIGYVIRDITAFVNMPAAISEIHKKSIGLFPNPVSDESISFSLESYDKFTVEIINSLGKVASRHEIHPDGSDTNHKIPISNFQNGLYSIRISGINFYHQEKFLVLNH